MTQSGHATLTNLPMQGSGRLRASVSALPARPPVAIRAGMLPWVPFWLSCGIGGWFLLPQEPGADFYAGLLVVAALCLIGLRLAPRLAGQGRIGWAWLDHSQLAALSLLLVVTGAGVAGLRAHLVAAPVLDFRYYGPVEGRVIGIDRSSRDRMRLLLDQVRLRDVAPGRTPERVRISLLQDDGLPVAGQQVMLTAHLSAPSGPSEPGGFDFRRLAWFERIGAIGYTRTPIMSVAPPKAHSLLALHRVRISLAKAMQDRIGGQAGAIAAALMTGDRSGISEATNEAMRASNLYHIISISGLHMSMLAGFVYTGLRILASLVQGAAGLRVLPAHKLAAGGALVASALYLWLSGGGVATERAFITVAVMLLAIIADRRAVSLRTVAVAATIVLLLGPEALTQPGFQMSFAATVGLILVSEPWQRFCGRIPAWVRPVVMLVLTSVVAGLATSPIAAAHFGRMTQFGLLANMLVVPVVGALVMPGGVIAALLAPLGLAQPALWLMGVGTKWMIAVAQWVASLDGSVLYVPAAPRAVLPLFGIGMMMIFLAPMLARQGKLGGTGPRRIAGIAMIALAALLWGGATRPTILISASGDAVAVMTPAGRAPSREKGGTYAVSNWLAADGDPADQATAARRPLWHGVPADRWADISHDGKDYRVRHVTAKLSREQAKAYCAESALLIASSKLGAGWLGKCQVVDLKYLLNGGSVSADLDANGFMLTRAEHQVSRRIWQ